MRFESLSGHQALLHFCPSTKAVIKPSSVHMRAVLLLALQLHPAAAFSTTPRVVASRTARSRCASVTCCAFAYEQQDPLSAAQDALMSRSVDLQLSRFAMVHDMACKIWLRNTWVTFTERSACGCAHSLRPVKLRSVRVCARRLRV